MKKLGLIVGIVILLGIGFHCLFSTDVGENPENGSNRSNAIAETAADLQDGDASRSENSPEADGNDDSQPGDEDLTEEEKREQAEEKLVEKFDAETDRWMDAEKTKPPTMQEVNAFHAMFRQLPKSRKEECLHRALNLIPDENVMLLVGILMDKTEDKELVELIYNDVLNRDEDVKKPILQTIFKDKEHPCWADTAWILDVTGELPKTQK